MPPEEMPSAPRTGESASAVIPPLTPDQFSKLMEKVLELLMNDLKTERERIGAPSGLQRWRGIRR